MPLLLGGQILKEFLRNLQNEYISLEIHWYIVKVEKTRNGIVHIKMKNNYN